MKVTIIGGGVAGLAAAYDLSKKDYDVTLIEKSPALGGLASSFPLEEGFIERYYHFVCLNDYPLFEMLNEFDMADKLHWVKTKMGIFYDSSLLPFGRAVDLLKFPYLSFAEKMKFGLGLMAVKSQSEKGWLDIENVRADEWLKKEFGENVYKILHEPLIRHKFGDYADKLSAAWMWARIHRIGKSRTKILQREILGFIEGGTKTLVDEISRRITANGGKIVTSTKVERIVHKNNTVCAVEANGEEIESDAVISTVPSPELLEILPDVNGDYWEKIRKIESIGVVCALLLIKDSISENFWLNINDSRIKLAGIIEYSNLNPCGFLKGARVIYMPQYISSDSPIFKKSSEDIVKEYSSYLKLIKPEFSDDWILKSFVFRDRFAQPICDIGFRQLIPGIKTSMDGLYITDSCQLHPDDRTIANSINLGRTAAKMISK